MANKFIQSQKIKTKSTKTAYKVQDLVRRLVVPCTGKIVCVDLSAEPETMEYEQLIAATAHLITLTEAKKKKARTIQGINRFIRT